MATAQTSPVLRYVRQLAASSFVAELPDEALIERFRSERDETAFAVLVRRHGPLVLGVCRRILRDDQLAEDCLQVTFLLLARKAGSLRKPRALSAWLYGVASRTARKLRAQTIQRRHKELQAPCTQAVAESEALDRQELRSLLDDSIAQLPDRYRVPFVMHYLQGLTVSEVALRLRCPRGTVATRLLRARERLRLRLAARGLVLSTAGLAAVLIESSASAAVPAFLIASTTRAAALSAAGQALGPGLISAQAAALTQGGGVTMKGLHLKLAALLLAAASVLAVSVGVYRARAVEPRPTPSSPKPALPAREIAANPMPRAHRQVRIRARILQGDPNGSRKEGTVKLLSEPQLITADGCPCSALTGGERVLDHGPGPVLMLEYGTRIKLTPTLGKGKDVGKVFVDACLDITSPEDEPGNRVRMKGRNVRYLGWHRLGEVVKLCLQDDAEGKRQTWAEVLVEEN